MSVRFKTNHDFHSFGGQRRSHRVHIAISVLVRGKRGNVRFEEETTTTVVNSAGGPMLMIATPLQGELISMISKKTAEELACEVAFVGAAEGNRAQVGFEFLEPSPKFWRIAFPPDNGDASERKRPGGGTRSLAPAPVPPTTARK